MERRIVALVLIAAGVWTQWGPGFGLIVAGALFGMSGIEFRVGSVGPVVRRGWERVSARTRAVAVAMPRRTAAVVLIAVAAVSLPLGALLAAGAWAALLAAGSLSAAVGAVLGWE